MAALEPQSGWNGRCRSPFRRGCDWLFRGELFRAPQFNPPEKSIAVVPFFDLSQAKDQEYFCDGMSEEILEALAKVDGLRVVARTSSFSFQGRSVNAREVGEK